MYRIKNVLHHVKNYKFNSLFVKNLIIIVLMIMIPIDAVCILFYINSSKSMQKEIQHSNNNLAHTIRDITDTIVKEIETFTINTALQDNVASYMMYPAAPNEGNENQVELMRYMKNYIYTNQYLHSIYLYCDKNNTILANTSASDFDKFNDTGWYPDYQPLGKDDVKIVLRAQEGIYPYFLSFIKPVYVTDTDRLGAVVVNVNVQKLVKAFKNVESPNGQEVYIVGGDGRVIYSSVQDEIMNEASLIPLLQKQGVHTQEDGSVVRMDGERYLSAAIDSQYFDWSYFCFLPMDFYHDQLSSAVLLLVLLLIMSLIVAAAASFYISTRTYQPISSILTLIDSPEKWMENLYADAPQNETAYILKQIGSALRTNKELTAELENRLLLLKHAQTVALQSQINPHFLFNTLDTINWMALDALEGDNKVSEALTILGDFFKMNIDSSNYLTNLEQEIDYTRQYMVILKMRFENAFTVKWEIDDAVKQAKIPRLVLQPIIENAVYHGIKPKGEENGVITVSALKSEKGLTLRVCDNGCGIDDERLETLKRELNMEYVSGSSHIGLKNVNQRIKLIYGNEYGIRIESGSWGTEVLLQMPYVV